MKEINIKGTREVIYKHTLNNGLNIFIWPYKLSEEVALSLTVKYGSIHTRFRYDGKDVTVPCGIAHFLEHIKFNEKKDVSAHDFFYKHGSYTNAYTTYDHTSYEVMCNNNVKENLEHLLYFVFNPFFTKSLIQKEKPIIIEESKMSLDNPYSLGYKKLMENIYINDNRKYVVTGLKDDIKAINIDDIKKVFDAYYVPSNMFLTITGNVNPYEVVKIAEEFFAKDDVKKEIAQNILPKEPNNVSKNYEEIRTNVTKEKVLLAVKISKSQFKDISNLKLKILFNIIMDINFGTTSIFNEHLIKNNLVDDFSFMTSVEDNHIVILIESSTSYPTEITKMIKEKFKKLDFNEPDFNRKNKAFIASSILGYEDVNEVNQDIRNDVIKYDDIIDNLQDIFKKLKASEGNNLIKSLKDYKVSAVVLLPKEVLNS